MASGGVRAGAGRKALGEDKRQKKSITIKEDLLEEIKKILPNKTLSQMIDICFLEYLKNHK